MAPVIGRFAPSPTGPLHAGSVVAALASWLDARARGGRWLVRIEDVDGPRCPPGAAQTVLAQLDALGLRPDAPPLWQSRRGAAYQAALQRLQAAGQAYPCACSRQSVALAATRSSPPAPRFAERVYPGTCRAGLGGRAARAWRVRTDAPAGAGAGADVAAVLDTPGHGPDIVIDWCDQRLGPQRQNLTQAVGDFILRRADGLWAYQLAVVVDDGDQGISDVVRGADLCDNTARQIHLQRLLGLPTPRYLHTPLVLGVDGHKLSKQNGAKAVNTDQPLATLDAAAQVLGLPALPAASLADWLAAAVPAWADLAACGWAAPRAAGMA